MDKLPLALQRLASRGHDFSLRQAVMLLESFKDEVSLRYVVRPSSELSFAAGEIRRCWIDEDGLWVIEANVLALAGGGSPLPHYWIERAAAEDRGGESLRGLLNFINGSVYKVLVDCWRHVEQIAHPNGWVDSWRSLTVTSRSHDELGLVPDLYCRPRSGKYALQSLVQRVSGTMAVAVSDRVHTWVGVDSAEPTEQGGLGGSTGLKVGEDFCLGGKTVVAGGMTKIVIGPLQHLDAVELSPGSARGEALKRLVGLYLGQRNRAQIELLIAPGERDTWVMGADQWRLGCSTWLAGNAERESSLLFSITTE
ncbi:type VI secretion system baseplate subunit TssG [Halorhodospira halochloris]|uniref:type VI secretion system baseplate subunit TssG n=1 Tax=Halorhodospira halochloris TaxID=1052 RepID=UPI001EE8642C|nr:type VI secretion system baseplate subunit TssG [Halorhodospira halochloris]MCG5529628.1 type VI secretion system baseplate subunit TssG [Halorhodospira halochloris]